MRKAKLKRLLTSGALIWSPKLALEKDLIDERLRMDVAPCPGSAVAASDYNRNARRTLL